MFFFICFYQTSCPFATFSLALLLFELSICITTISKLLKSIHSREQFGKFFREVCKSTTFLKHSKVPYDSSLEWRLFLYTTSVSSNFCLIYEMEAWKSCFQNTHSAVVFIQPLVKNWLTVYEHKMRNIFGHKIICQPETDIYQSYISINRSITYYSVLLE